MGLPELYFSYSVAAQTAIARAKQGIVALLLQDTRVTAGVYTVSHEADIPAELGADNANYVKRALVGSTNRPQKLYLSVVGAEGTVEDALGQLTPRTYDYVACGEFFFTIPNASGGGLLVILSPGGRVCCAEYASEAGSTSPAVERVRYYAASEAIYDALNAYLTDYIRGA